MNIITQSIWAWVEYLSKCPATKKTTTINNLTITIILHFGILLVLNTITQNYFIIWTITIVKFLLCYLAFVKLFIQKFTFWILQWCYFFSNYKIVLNILNTFFCLNAIILLDIGFFRLRSRNLVKIKCVVVVISKGVMKRDYWEKSIA